MCVGKLTADQCYGRGLPFGVVLVSGSESLARVTSLFLAVIGFRVVDISRYEPSMG